MARRAAAANTADDKEQAPAKELRRDSKGFENFDDYFDSDGNDTTINTAGEKTIDESVEEVSATEVWGFCRQNIDENYIQILCFFHSLQQKKKLLKRKETVLLPRFLYHLKRFQKKFSMKKTQT